MFCSHVCTFKKKSSQYSFTNVSWDNSGTLVTYNSEILGYTTIAVGKGGLLVSHISSAAAHVLAVIGLHSFCVVGGTIPTRKPTALEVVFHARWTLLMPSGLNSVGRGGGGWGRGAYLPFVPTEPRRGSGSQKSGECSANANSL